MLEDTKMLMLKYLRKQFELTQKQVADILGISQNNYSYIENGKVKISEEYIEILCKYYGCSKGYLLDGNEHNKEILTTQTQKELEMIDFIMSGEERFDYYKSLSDIDKKTFIFYLLHSPKEYPTVRKTLVMQLKQVDVTVWLCDGIATAYQNKQNNNKNE